MTANGIEMQGTLREDGTLVLDEKPHLPPGRVKVIVQAQQSAEGEETDVIAVLKRIHAAQALRGHGPRSAEEIEAYLRESRDDPRDRMIEQLQEECRQQRESPQPTEVQ